MKLLQWCSGIGLLCLCSWTVYPQSILEPQPAATRSAITNKTPDIAPPPLKSPASGKTGSVQPSEITTLDGKTYKGVTIQRVDPDGLMVYYTPVGGGIGANKIKFKNLSDNLQRQYNYDPAKAAAYEALQAQGMAAWRVQSQREAEATKRAGIQRAQQDAFEQQKAELEQQQKKAHPEMTEEQKKEAQKQIEATWSRMTSAVKAGRITN